MRFRSLASIVAVFAGVAAFVAMIAVDDVPCQISHDPYAAQVTVDGKLEPNPAPVLHCGQTYRVTVFAPGYDEQTVAFTPHWYQTSLFVRLNQRGKP